MCFDIAINHSRWGNIEVVPFVRRMEATFSSQEIFEEAFSFTMTVYMVIL